MNALWQAPAVVILVVTWFSTPPTSLADVARREALRRAIASPSIGSFSNVDLPETPPAAAVSGIAPAGQPPPAAETQAAAPAEPGDEPTRDQDWWRSRMNAARTSLERNQVLAEALQSRVNALQADVVNIDDPAQQAEARQKLGRALGELERLQKQVEADGQEIATIREEARRQRVPPGWIR